MDCNGDIVHCIWEMDQIDFLTELNDDVAAEIAKTRILQVNAKGYILKDAKVEAGSDLPAGVTVKTLDGKNVTPDTQMPKVQLLYAETGCIEDETERTTKTKVKVDAAIADYDDEQNLPTTGEQALFTFLMSATALLGLGIFLAYSGLDKLFEITA